MCTLLQLSLRAGTEVVLVLQDGPRGGGGGEERGVQPAVRHLGRGHHCHRAGRAAAPHVRPAPHEVCSRGAPVAPEPS